MLKKKVNNIFIIYFLIELFCPLCECKDKHNTSHKIIDINDEESLKKNNIDYKEYYSEFNKLYDETKKINDKIEMHIGKINKHHRNILRSINSTYNRRRYKLNYEERELKYELNSKVKEINEELDKFLDESKRIIANCKRISQAIINFNENINNPVIKTLTYISEINNNNIRAKNLLKEPKRTLIFSYDESEDSIDYKNYYFDGLPIPEDIHAEINNDNELVISWNINKSKIKEVDKNKIKYKIETKRDNNISTYETSETELAFENFEENCEYKVRIKSCLNKSESEYSKIKIFKTDDSIKNKKCLIFNNTSNSLFSTVEKKENGLLKKSSFIWS